MKALQTQIQIGRITLRKDDSVSFSAETPTFSGEEVEAFRQLSKGNIRVLFEAMEGSSDVLQVKEPVDDTKTPAQRLRAVLFVWWEQLGRPNDDFELFYRMKMEKIIDLVKEKLT